jgi:hypothetical protein
MKIRIITLILLLPVLLLAGSSCLLSQDGTDGLKKEIIEPDENPFPLKAPLPDPFTNLKMYISGTELNISCEPEKRGDIIVQLIDISGKVYYYEIVKLNGNKLQFKYDISSLTHSYYIVRLTQGKNLTSRKILI